jgi:acyl transferase domain-containing protein
VIRSRAGAAFDPEIAELYARRARDIFTADPQASVWSHTLTSEPGPGLELEGKAIDDALAAMGDFADLVSPFLIGHSAGVAKLADAAGRLCGLDDDEVRGLRRAALVHDIGRVTVPARVWQATGALSPATGRSSGCTPTTPSASSAGHPSSNLWAQRLPCTMNGSTAPATTADARRQRSRCRLGFLLLRTATTP